MLAAIECPLFNLSSLIENGDAICSTQWWPERLPKLAQGKKKTRDQTSVTSPDAEYRQVILGRHLVHCN